MSEILQDNIPEKTLKQGGVSIGGVEETKGEAEDTVAQMVEGERDKETADDVSRLSADDDEDEGATEEIKSIEFLKDTVFKLQGTQTMGVVMLKRKLYGLVVEKDADFFCETGYDTITSKS